MSELKITKGRWHNIGVLLWSSIGTAHEVQTACIANFDTGDVTDDEEFANVKMAAAAPDLYEALEGAKQFIENGIELGYITMPDKDTPDSAHGTLPKINAALAKARGEQT